MKEKLSECDITIDAREYGGFEKVGSLGFSLPKNDTQYSTDFGDIMLYQSNQITLFYESNSWSYTKIGHVDNLTQEELSKEWNILTDPAIDPEQKRIQLINVDYLLPGWTIEEKGVYTKLKRNHEKMSRQSEIYKFQTACLFLRVIVFYHGSHEIVTLLT